MRDRIVLISKKAITTVVAMAAGRVVLAVHTYTTTLATAQQVQFFVEATLG